MAQLKDACGHHTEKCGEDDQRQERNLATRSNKLGVHDGKNATALKLCHCKKAVLAL